MRLEQINKKQGLFESLGLRDPYFETWEREIHPGLIKLAMLNEGVALTPDQIDQIFGAAQKGGGRTFLGKAADAVKGATDKISDVWFNKFGGMLQSSQPVKDFDAKFEEIKSKLATKYPDLATKLAKYGEFAKANPNLHKFLLAIAGSVAAAAGVAVAGGVGAGALAVGTGAGVATGIVNIADRLLQGQKASTAIGRGATAGLVAGLTAGAIAKAKDVLDQLSAVKVVKEGGIANFNGHTFYLKPEESKLFNDAVKASMKATNDLANSGGLSNLGSVMDANSARMAEVTAQILQKASNPQYQEAAYQMLNVGKTIDPGVVGQAASAVSSALGVVQPVLSALAGQSAASAGQEPTPAPTAESRQAYKAKIIVEFLDKISSKNLRKKWEAAGSPTDSDAIAQIMTDAGANPEVIKNAFTQVGVEAPASLTTPAPADATSATTDAPVTDPAADATSATTDAPVTDPAADATTPAADATTPAAPVTGNEWKELRDKFEAFQDAGGSMVPGVRGVLRDILLQAFAVVENKKHKWYALKTLLEADLRREQKRSLVESKRRGKK